MCGAPRVNQYKRRTKTRYRSKWGKILARQDDGQRPVRQVAAEVGCSESVVYYWRRVRVAIAERAREEEKRGITQVHCTRCGFLGEEQNPIGQSGLCLYCRLIMRGVNLLHWYASGAAEEYLRRQRDGYGKRDDSVGGDEASGVCV